MEVNPLAPITPAPISEAQNNFRKQELSLLATDIKNKVDKEVMDFSSNFKDFLHTSSNSSPLSSFAEKRLKFNKFDIDVTEAYKPLSSGKLVPMFDNVIGGTNNEQRFAEQQSTSSKWMNGLGKLIGKTTTSVLGGTIGTVAGIANWAKTGSFQSTYDNDFYNMLDDLNTRMDYKLPNYYTEQEKLNSFGANLMTANFWANDVLGAASFTLGAVVSEAIWASVTGGSSLSTTFARQGMRLGKFFGSGARTVEKINKAKAISKMGVLKGFANAKLPTELATRFGKAGELLNTARFTYTSAGYEAGVEARHFMRESKEQFLESFRELNGRDPNAQEYAEFEANNTKAANTLFAFNMGIVGSSNLAVFGKLLKIKSPLSIPTKWANETLFGIGTRKTAQGGVEALKATKFQNILAKSYSFVKTPLVEGLFEEGMQSSGSNTAKNWVQATYDPEKTQNTVSLGTEFVKGIGETYGSKEGWKEIGIGMIVGLLSGTGVSLARGKGAFGELSDARKEAENEAIVRNKYTVEKLLDRIHTANRVTYFNEQTEKAEEKGDITGAELSRASAMLANINVAYNYGNTKEDLEEVKIGISTMDNGTLMKQYGLENEEQAEELKSTLFSDYERLSKEYAKQREFVDYMIDNNSEELKHTSSVNLVKEALAYELTLGSKAYEFSKELLGDIQKTIAGSYNSEGQTISNALQAQDILWSASKEVRRDFKIKQKELKKSRIKKDSLEKERLSLEKSKNSKEDNKSDLNRLNAVVVEIQENERETQKLERELEGVLSAAQLQNPYNKEDQSFITSRDLENVDADLKSITELIEDFKNINPREGYRLEGVLKEYQKSKVAFMRYADLSRQLSDPNLGLRGKRNIFKELVSDKTPTEITVEFIKEMDENMRRINEERAVQAIESMPEFRSAKASMENPAPEQKKVSTIKDIIEANPYLFEYVGSADNAKKPTEEEINEYKELVARIRKDKNINNRVATQNSPDYYSKKGIKTSVSKSEMARFQELNQKMSDWRFYESVENAEGISMADLIEQELSRQAEVKPPKVQEELGVDDYVLIATPSEVDPKGQEYRNSSVIQTYENVKVQLIDGNFYFSHLHLSSLLKGEYEVIIKTPKKFDENGFAIEWNKPEVATYEQILSNQNKYGTYFTIKTASGDLTASVSSQGRLQIPVGEFNRAKEELGLDIFKALATRTTYADLYEKDAEGNYKQKDSDFILEQEIGAEEIQYAPEEVLELPVGANTFFKVNLKDSYNAELKRKYDAGEITLETVIDQVKVYSTAANGKILGDIKSNQGITNAPENFLEIRRIGAEILLAKDPKQDVVTIPYVAKVKYVLLGVPNLTTTKAEDGMVPQSINLTDKAVEQIVDYGYMENGELKLKEKTKDVRLDFVSKLSKKSNIPVIVFKQGSYLVAYPVSLIKQDSNISEDVMRVFNSKVNNSDKVTIINTMLSENSITPDLYYNTEDDQNLLAEDGTPSPVMQKHLTILSERKDTANVEDWLEKSHTKENLKDEVTITVDLESRPLKSPKVIIDFNEAEINQSEIPWYDTYIATGEVSEEKIHEISNKAIQAGLTISPKESYINELESLNNRIKELKNKISPLDAQLKSIKPSKKGAAFTESQNERRNALMDELEPLQDEIRGLYRNVSLLNANPSLTIINKTSVFSQQELDVYNNEQERIKKAINEIVKLDSEKERQANERKRKEC